MTRHVLQIIMKEVTKMYFQDEKKVKETVECPFVINFDDRTYKMISEKEWEVFQEELKLEC